MAQDSATHTMLGPTSAQATGKDFKDARGRLWLVTGKVTARDLDVGKADKERINNDDYPSGPDPLTLSREDLAEKLRPRRLVGGYEYRLEQPDYDVAEMILGMRDLPTTDAYAGNGNGQQKMKFIIGPDNRQRVTNPAVFPGSANAHLSQTCTATMIGPSTAVCAAHCFFQNGWIQSRSITFGANTTAPTAPFGSFLADSLTLPGAWNATEWDWDFAVLEFSPSRPDLGRQTGWFGTGQNFNGGKTMIGYPNDKPMPSSWIKSGNFTAAPGARYEHNLDVIPGDSGAGTYDNADNRVNGIQSTQRRSGTRTWNEVRRWDATTHNFFRAYGNWPRL